MPVPDQNLVEKVLAKDGRAALCRQAIEGGWEDLRGKQPDLAWWRRKTTRAAIMWENVVDRAIKLFDGKSGIKHIPHYDTASFIFDDLVLARFKLADIGLVTSNYPTAQARLFHQHQTEDLFGFRGHHRIELVHVINRFGTALDWIGVVARDRHKVLWKFELPAGGAAVAPLPIAPKPAPAADTVLRPAKPAPEKKDDENKKGN